MKKFIRNMALNIPWLDRLHRERNQYAAELETARTKINQLEQQQHYLIDSNNALLQASIKAISEFAASREKTKGRRLHVIGFARSGTTILMDILNSSPEIFLFSELNAHVLTCFPGAFAGYGGDTFISQFENRKRQELPIQYKGALSPVKFQPEEMTSVDNMFERLRSEFSYSGDKIAAGSREFCGAHDFDLLSAFIKHENQNDAIMIYVLRRPSENLASVMAMFPQADYHEWLFALIRFQILLVRAFLEGNRTCLVFHQDISPDIVAELSKMLDVPLPISPVFVGEDYKTHHIAYEEHVISDLDACYSRLFALFDGDIKIKRSVTDAVAKKITNILQDYEAALGRIGDAEHFVINSNKER